jgi:hypothetical protein
MKSMDVEVPLSVASAYAGAVAGNGDVIQAQKFISGMKEELGYEPDEIT